MIRKACLADAASIAKLARLMWTSPEDELTADFKALLAHDDAAVFLCEADGRIICFAKKL